MKTIAEWPWQFYTTSPTTMILHPPATPDSESQFRVRKQNDVACEGDDNNPSLPHPLDLPACLPWCIILSCACTFALFCVFLGVFRDEMQPSTISRMTWNVNLLDWMAPTHKAWLPILSPSIRGDSNSHTADQLPALIQGHRILHYNCLRMRLRGWCRSNRRRKRKRMLLLWCRRPMLLLSRQWHPHTRHGNGSHILTKSTLDRLRPVRIHKRRTATTAVDMRHGRCFHSQIHGMTTGALHTSGTSHVHQQSPASSTYQLRHHLCSTMRRHTGDRATQGTSHITSSLWIYQQRMTASTYQLTLCSSCSSLHLLIRHHNNNNSSHLFSFLSLSLLPSSSPQ